MELEDIVWDFDKCFSSSSFSFRFHELLALASYLKSNNRILELQRILLIALYDIQYKTMTLR